MSARTVKQFMEALAGIPAHRRRRCRRDLTHQPQEPTMATPHIGARVICPPDRGSRSHPAIVTHFTDEIHTNHQGIRFVWVTVRYYDGEPGGVWPSHRLGFKH